MSSITAVHHSAEFSTRYLQGIEPVAEDRADDGDWEDASTG